MIVLVGKSGCGKTSLERRLTKEGFSPIVSYTTRERRQGEIRGQSYHFVSRPDFETLERKGFFLETSTFNGNRYGAAKKDFKDNAVVVLDVNGLKAVQDYFNETKERQVISFLIDVDEDELAERMRKRGDTAESIQKRLDHDRLVFAQAKDYVTYVVHNVDLDQSVAEILEKYASHQRKKVG